MYTCIAINSDRTKRHTSINSPTKLRKYYDTVIHNDCIDAHWPSKIGADDIDFIAISEASSITTVRDAFSSLDYGEIHHRRGQEYTVLLYDTRKFELRGDYFVGGYTSQYVSGIFADKRNSTSPTKR